MPGDGVALPGLQGLLDIAVRKMQNGNQVAVFSVCSLSLWKRVGVRASNGISFWGNVPFTRPSASAFPQPFERPEMPGGAYAYPAYKGHEHVGRVR